jgi:hypothetical protein
VRGFARPAPGRALVVGHHDGNEFLDAREFLNGLPSQWTDYDFIHMLHTLLVVAVPRQVANSLRSLRPIQSFGRNELTGSRVEKVTGWCIITRT